MKTMKKRPGNLVVRKQGENDEICTILQIEDYIKRSDARQQIILTSCETKLDIACGHLYSIFVAAIPVMKRDSSSISCLEALTTASTASFDCA